MGELSTINFHVTAVYCRVKDETKQTVVLFPGVVSNMLYLESECMCKVKDLMKIYKVDYRYYSVPGDSVKLLDFLHSLGVVSPFSVTEVIYM